MRFDIVTAGERESLYNEVWKEPVTEVAKRYEISDVALRKRCIKLGIPLPPSGYWARVRAGQKVPKTPLPKVTGELKKVVRNYIIRYKTDIKNLSDQELMADEELGLEKNITSDANSDVGITDSITENITDTQKEILKLIAVDPSITQQKISEVVGISRRNINANMTKLKEAGVLKRVGTDRKGFWEIINNINKEDE